MSFDLDREIDRTGTNSIKWEFLFEEEQLVYGDHAAAHQGEQRLLPLGIADMDFRCPPAVVEALVTRAQHGIFGYGAPSDSYYEAVIGWMQRHYGRTVKKEWIVTTPGVVAALYALVQAFVAPGEKVLIQPPVYHPFYYAIENTERVIVTNPLILKDGRYQMDFDDLAEKAADPDVKMAMLCSPHNPVGRVWTAAELTRFGEICQENEVLVVSDDIHCDLIYPGQKFTAYGALNDTLASQSITCTAPSKTFNLAGLKTSNIVIPDEALRTKFSQTLQRCGIHGTNAFGIVATETAYNHGEEWLAAVMDYVVANFHFMETFIAAEIPLLQVIPPEGTYLVWVDCRKLGLDADALSGLMRHEARLLLNDGVIFGEEGSGFVRFNIACPRSILATALRRLKAAVNQLEPILP